MFRETLIDRVRSFQARAGSASSKLRRPALNASAATGSQAERFFCEAEGLADGETLPFHLVVALRGETLQSLSNDKLWLHREIKFWESHPGGDHELYRLCVADCHATLTQFTEAMKALTEALRLFPELASDVASSDQDAFQNLDASLWAKFKVAHLGATLRRGGRVGDGFREDYCQLLRAYSNDSANLKRIRALGPLIKKAVDDGRLPRAFVLRPLR